MNRTLNSTAFSLLLLAAPISAHEGHDHPEGQASTPEAAISSLTMDDAREREYFTDLPVTDQHGRSLRFYSDVLSDRVVLLHFIYTDCTDFCPAMTAKLAKVKERLAEMPEAQTLPDITFVSISTNPTQDTSEVLRDFAERHGIRDADNWFFLTGDPRAIDAISRRLGEVSPDHWAHSTLLLAGNVRARAWARIAPQAPPEAIALKLVDLASFSVNGNEPAR